MGYNLSLYREMASSAAAAAAVAASAAGFDDYYAILQVPCNASHETITKSYRRLALECHPDRRPQDPESTAHFHRLSAAYETMKAPWLRGQYHTIWTHWKQYHVVPELPQSFYYTANPHQPQASFFFHPEHTEPCPYLDTYGAQPVLDVPRANTDDGNCEKKERVNVDKSKKDAEILGWISTVKSVEDEAKETVRRQIMTLVTEMKDLLALCYQDPQLFRDDFKPAKYEHVLRDSNWLSDALDGCTLEDLQKKLTMLQATDAEAAHKLVRMQLKRKRNIDDEGQDLEAVTPVKVSKNADTNAVGGIDTDVEMQDAPADPTADSGSGSLSHNGKYDG
ncbi:hypothetical protein KCU88_g4398, partial [Aureobasidium melanogenum]